MKLLEGDIIKIKYINYLCEYIVTASKIIYTSIEYCCTEIHGVDSIWLSELELEAAWKNKAMAINNHFIYDDATPVTPKSKVIEMPNTSVNNPLELTKPEVFEPSAPLSTPPILKDLGKPNVSKAPILGKCPKCNGNLRALFGTIKYCDDCPYKKD